MLQRFRVTTLTVLLACYLVPASPAQEPVPVAEEVARWTFDGEIEEAEDVSGIAVNGGFAAIVADEKATLQILEQEENGTEEPRFVADPERSVELESDERFDEADLEGVAWGAEHLYLVGSHSRKRERVKDDKSVKKNRKRLATTAIEPGRGWLYRVEVDDRGRPGQVESVSLRDVLANDGVLSPFQVIPSKENGIDIEGLAVDDGERLYVGFRGPVLRGGYAPVMVVEFDDEFRQKDLEHEVRYLDLGGRGIRGLSRAGDGFLVLAGPVGDGPGSYRVFSWNGRDGVPGKDAPETGGNVVALCDVTLPSPDAKAEGISVLGREGDFFRFAVVYDSVANGGPTVFRCAAD